MRANCNGITEVDGAGVAEVAAAVIQCSAACVVRLISPITNSVCWKPILREHVVFAFSMNKLASYGPCPHLIDERRLDVIFASEAVRIKCDLVIQAAPLA